MISVAWYSTKIVIFANFGFWGTLQEARRMKRVSLMVKEGCLAALLALVRTVSAECPYMPQILPNVARVLTGTTIQF